MKLYDLLLIVDPQTNVKVYDAQSFILLAKNKIPAVIREMTQKDMIFNTVHSMSVNLINELIVKIYKE